MNLGALALIMLNFLIVCGFVIARVNETGSFLNFNLAALEDRKDLVKKRKFQDVALSDLLLEDE